MDNTPTRKIGCMAIKSRMADYTLKQTCARCEYNSDDGGCRTYRIANNLKKAFVER